MRPQGLSPITWPDQSEWFDVPKQKRSRDTMQRVFDAAIKLFSSRGFDQTTTEDIASEAGVTKGSIYRRFPDKEALLYTIIEAYRHSRVPHLERWAASEHWSEASCEDVLQFYINVVIGSYRQDAPVIRIIERRALVDPKTSGMIEEMNDWLVASLTRWLTPHLTAFSPEDLAVAVRQAHTMVRAVLVHLILPDDGITPDRMAMLGGDRIEGMIRQTLASFLRLPDPD